ncbi:hypothetical protein [Botrimarina sp.]|uniref:hypothetical protein n=1 Tax=Botrimarina sp. TaxID=2795802 RepID=UPI0032EF0981
MLSRRRPPLLLFATAAMLVGCSPYMRTPRWCDPGNTATQRYEAIYTDPYPLPDVGPEIVGGRPREYQAPVPQVVRGRLLNPPPSVTPPAPSAPPVVGPPRY